MFNKWTLAALVAAVLAVGGVFFINQGDGDIAAKGNDQCEIAVNFTGIPVKIVKTTGMDRPYRNLSANISATIKKNDSGLNGYYNLILTLTSEDKESLLDITRLMEKQGGAALSLLVGERELVSFNSANVEDNKKYLTGNDLILGIFEYPYLQEIIGAGNISNSCS